VEEIKSAPRVLVGNHEGKVPSGDIRHRGERYVKMDLKYIICGILHRCISLRTGSSVRSVEERHKNLAFTNCGNFLTK
jgi:hypothetical protein